MSTNSHVIEVVYWNPLRTMVQLKSLPGPVSVLDGVTLAVGQAYDLCLWNRRSDRPSPAQLNAYLKGC